MIFSLIASTLALTPLCNNPTAKCEIDKSKYLGGWFEIGRTSIIRNTFERNCECVEAKYAPLADKISVTNTCVGPKGDFTTIQGTATPLSNSELKVVFPGNGKNAGIATAIQNAIPGANYVVKNVWVDEQGNYQRALVVAPLINWLPNAVEKHFEFTWILSRTSSISEQDIKETLDYVKAAGYHPEESDFQLTEQVKCRGSVPSQQ